MIKILAYGMTSNFGGIEVYLVNLLKNIDKNKIKIDYVIFGEKSPFEQEITANGGEIFYIPNKSKGIIKNIKIIRKLLKKSSKTYDCIYFNSGALFYAVPYFMAWIYNFKNIIVHAHNGKDPNRSVWEVALHKFNRTVINHIADYKFSCSDIATEWIFGKKYVGNKSIYKINNAVDCNKYKYLYEKRKVLCNELNINEDAFIIGNVARLDSQKNHSFLLKIFKEILKSNETSILLIIGDGALKDSLIKQAEKMNISKSVLFLGLRKDIHDLLNTMDIFVLTSLFEGFPITLVEAQVNGLPCFVSNTVTKEVNITGLIEYISLDDSPKKWADEILSKFYNYKRKSYYSEMCNFGYDLKSNTNKIEKIFMNMK
ncbi:MAG: glycosyltransferase family 1 protein [Clostridium beijerinckii]|nr:glycosyltransferase family 1 protein [Clostridium beijerinckii]